MIASAFALLVTVPPLPAAEWTPHAQLVLARALHGEGGSLDDARAMAWILARRWRAVHPRRGWSFVELVTRYCAPLRRDVRLTPRRARIRAMRWRDVAPALRELVTRWGAGRERDPCAGAAVHWDSEASARRRGLRMRRVRCAGAQHYQAYFAGRASMTATSARTRRMISILSRSHP